VEVRHFPEPPRIYVTIAGKPRKVHYLTRADAAALVATLCELCGGVPEDMATAFKAILANHEACLHMLCEAFPDVDVMAGVSEDVRAALLEVVWSANDISLILEDMQREAAKSGSDETDPLSWPKMLLDMNRYFGIDEDTVLHKWTYWQFKGYMAAVSEIMGSDGTKKNEGMPMEELVRQGFRGM